MGLSKAHYGFANIKRRFVSDMAGPDRTWQGWFRAFIAFEFHRPRCRRNDGGLPHADDKMNRLRAINNSCQCLS